MIYTNPVRMCTVLADADTYISARHGPQLYSIMQFRLCGSHSRLLANMHAAWCSVLMSWATDWQVRSQYNSLGWDIANLWFDVTVA